jgi:hypothetical protein
MHLCFIEQFDNPNSGGSQLRLEESLRHVVAAAVRGPQFGVHSGLALGYSEKTLSAGLYL